MIARGQHIQSINEAFAVRKSDGGVSVMDDSPYGASTGQDNMREIRKALSAQFVPDIDAAIKERQEANRA